MKKLTLFALATAAYLNASAQSVTITVVASSDGVTSTTNVIQVPQVRVNGLILLWEKDCEAKTNAAPPVPALTLGQFVIQEIRDRGTEYAKTGATAEMKVWGITNPPAKLVEVWPTLTLQQRTNAVTWHNLVGN